MALCTCRQVLERDSQLNVSCFRQIGLVFMTAEAGVFDIGVAMTDFTRYFILPAMVQWKIMLLQTGRRPGLFSMTELAAQSKETGMDLGFGVTIGAIGGCTGEDPIDVASFTLDALMNTVQREYVGVLKIMHPVSAIVARRTLQSKALLVSVHKLRTVGVF